MKVEVTPTSDSDQLRENLEKRVETVHLNGDKLEVETNEPEILGRVPGVESYTAEGGKEEGLGGKPVKEHAYIRIESREDVVKAFLATVDGYNLVVLNSDREWDLRLLRRFNPDIKHLKSDSPREELQIDQAVGDIEGKDEISIDMTDVDIDSVYRFINV